MALQEHMSTSRSERDRMPTPLRYIVLGGVGLLCVGALYLIAVRGEALLVDLAGLSGRIFCF
jgi:hypothetical protein